MKTMTKTDHPHIVRVEGVCGGQPIIDGMRITVRHVVRQIQLGDTVVDIIESLPYLTKAQVYDALSYYHDHQAEIDALIAENEEAHERLVKYGIDAVHPPIS